MLTGPTVILLLKLAVGVTTLLLLISLVALRLHRPRLHGFLNVLVSVLVLVAVLGLEVLLRLAGVDVTSHMDETARQALNIHLCFAIPLIPVLGLMLYTGRARRIKRHLILSILFTILWTGMFITGMFYLPHSSG